jgi:hypothetical protein
MVGERLNVTDKDMKATCLITREALPFGVCLITREALPFGVYVD